MDFSGCGDPKYQPNSPGGAILGDIETGSSVIGRFNTTIGYDFSNSQVFLDRSSDGSDSDTLASGPKAVWDVIRAATNPSGGSTVKLAIYVDQNSVETFVNDEGITALSGLVYPNQGAEGIEVVSGGGNLTLISFSYASYASLK